MSNYITNLAFYAPELTLTATMILLLFIYAFFKGASDGMNKFVAIATAFVLLFVSYLEINFLNAPITEIFSRAVVIDPFGSILKLVMLLGTLGVVFMGYTSKEIHSDLRFEFIVMALGVLIGSMLLVSSANMITLYIGLETISIISYSLAAMNKNSELSSEAGLKYVLYGGLASGLMLFGMSHLYGVFGTLSLYDLTPMFVGLSTKELIFVIPSLLFFYVGLGYKISTVPFHMWTPDVYEGSPIPVTAFFAIVPKVAGLGALYRMSMIIGGNESLVAHSWTYFIMVIAVLTMTVGNIAAIGQRSVKRMLAYSSISHAGFMLTALLVLSEIGARSLVFYGIIYLFMTLVAFMITEAVSDHYGNDYFDRFRGFVQRYPLMAILMIIMMLSLAGIPPLAGFIAKFNILAALVKKEFYGIAVIAGVNSVIALYYYMKIVRLMIFKDPESTDEIEGFKGLGQLVPAIFTFPVLFLGVFWEGILIFANGAKIFIK